MQGDYEDEEIDDEETQDDENQKEEPLGVDNVDYKFDSLDDHVLGNVTQEGFYVTYLSDEKVIDSKGNEIVPDEGEESKRQAVKRIGIEELFDFSGDNVVLNKDYRDKDIIFCKKPGQIFYGKIDFKEYKDKNGDRQIAVIPLQGRIYNDGECEYAGYFLNGNKDYGITIKGKNPEDSFLTDYKADHAYEKHGINDLLLSFDNNDIDSKRRKSDFNKYDNAIVYSSETGDFIAKSSKFSEKANVKNIKIQINNGYKYDFSKCKRDYLDENGNLAPISSGEKEKMFIDVDKIVDTILKYIDSCKDSLRTIEIVGMNNFGILEDKEGKKLINEILKKCKDVAINNNINVFFSNVGNNDIVTEVEEHYKGGEKSVATIDHGCRNYEKLNFLGENLVHLNKEEYEKQLFDLGYRSNVIKSTKKENIKDCSCLLTDSENYRDIISDLRNKKFEECEKKVEELEKKCEKIKNDKLQKPLKMKGQKKTDLSGAELLAVVVATFVLPFIGGLIVYGFCKANSKKRSVISDVNNTKKTSNGKQKRNNGEGQLDNSSKDAQGKNGSNGKSEQEGQQAQEESSNSYEQNNDKITYGKPKLNLNDQNALKDIKVN